MPIKHGVTPLHQRLGVSPPHRKEIVESCAVHAAVLTNKQQRTLSIYATGLRLKDDCRSCPRVSTERLEKFKSASKAESWQVHDTISCKPTRSCCFGLRLHQMFQTALPVQSTRTLLVPESVGNIQNAAVNSMSSSQSCLDDLQRVNCCLSNGTR